METILPYGARGQSTRPRPSLDTVGLDPFSPTSMARNVHADAGLACGKVVSPLDSVFPPAPTLDDIRRMEPDLSPQSMRRRASDCHGEIDRPAVRSVSASVEKTLVNPPVDEEDAYDGYDVPALSLDELSPATAKAVLKTKMSALSEFVVAFMLDMVQRQELPVTRCAPASGTQPGVAAMGRITSILTATTLPPAVPFLALWYARRLAAQMRRPDIAKDSHAWVFREMLYLGHPLALDTDELITRLFVVGLMIADAWLDDHSFAVKTWRDVAGMPSKTLHTIQIKALYVLNYKLMPNDQEWKGHIQQMASLLCRLMDPHVQRVADVVDIVDDLLCEVMVITPALAKSEPNVPLAKEVAVAAAVVSPPTTVARSPPPAVDVKPLVITKRSVPVEEITKAVKRKLPTPAEWSPQQDPVVLKSRRTASVAIGAERALKRLPQATKSPWETFMPNVHAQLQPPVKKSGAEASARRGPVGGRSSLDSAVPWMRPIPLGFMQRQSH
jgi:hypothetical protein